MTRTEAERQFYLGVSGVRLWYAREPLPGAAPSPDFDFGESDPEPLQERVFSNPAPLARGSEARSPASPDKAGGPSGKAVNLKALMDEPVRENPSNRTTHTLSPSNNAQSGTAMAEKTVAAEPEGATVGASASHAYLSLNLQVWLGSQFALISDLSTDASIRLQDTLARNILRSVGDDDVRLLGPLQWPVFNNPVVPGSRMEELIEVARVLLAPSVEQRALILGVPSTDGDSDSHWLSAATRQSPALEFPHTLAQIASDPGLKRELWTRLKPLVRR